MQPGKTVSGARCGITFLRGRGGHPFCRQRLIIFPYI
jgi:hypothetical protein